MMAMLQLFIAPAGGGGAHALGGVARARRRVGRGPAPGARRRVLERDRRRHALAQPARGAPRAARARGRRGRRRRGLVGALARGGARPPDARRRAGVGAGRPAAPAARRRGAGAHRRPPGARRPRRWRRSGRCSGSRPGPTPERAWPRRAEAAAPRRRRRARHAARRLLAGGHHGGGGDDAADRHRRRRFVGRPRGGHRRPSGAPSTPGSWSTTGTRTRSPA